MRVEMRGAWRRVVARPAATVRVLCVPHAGASASVFRGWEPTLPPWLEVFAAQLPGREDRWAEPPLTTLADTLADLMPGLRSLAGEPMVLFGHSLGATIAYEAARVLCADRSHRPDLHLVVSGKEAPQHHQRGRFHTASDAELGAEIARMRAGALSEPGVATYALPIVRADYTTHETYDPDPDAWPLPVPVTAVNGLADRELTVAQADGWRRHTTRSFTSVVLPGDHFHLVDHPAAVVASLVAVAQALRPGRS